MPAPALPRSPYRARVGYTCGMCGRFLLMTSGRDVAEEFSLADFPELFPRYNIAPTQAVLAVRAAVAGREGALLRWGLVPSWARDTKQAPINARAETAADKPLFRDALRKRRCLVPASGFYEWLALAGGKRKQPHCFRPGTISRGRSRACGSAGRDRTDPS